MVRSSIQTLSCMSIGRGMFATSTLGALFTEAVRGGWPAAGGVVWASAAAAVQAVTTVANGTRNIMGIPRSNGESRAL
jgi:hypothetical protein